MIAALVIAAALCLPVLAGPLIWPAVCRRREARTLAKLEEAASLLPSDANVAFEDIGVFRCERGWNAAGSARTCDGKVLDIVEEFTAYIKTSADDGGRRRVAVKIGEVCLRCGDVSISGWKSRVLGEGHADIRGADELARRIDLAARRRLLAAKRAV